MVVINRGQLLPWNVYDQRQERWRSGESIWLETQLRKLVKGKLNYFSVYMENSVVEIQWHGRCFIAWREEKGTEKQQRVPDDV